MVVCLFIFRVFGIIVIEVEKGEKELKQRKKVVNKSEIELKVRGIRKAHKINLTVRF